MENNTSKFRRLCYGGHINDNLPTVVSAPKKYNEQTGDILIPGDSLQCFSCQDESLYHDSFAYWNRSRDDLLCASCFKLKNETPGNWEDDLNTYIKVLTFH
jgi:hypothetical protein